MEKNIGTFKNISGTILIGDPIKDENVVSKNILKSVAKGNWNAYIDVLEESGTVDVSSLIIKHEDLDEIDDSNLIEQPFEIEVDSGHAGIFDKEHYDEDKLIDKSSLKKIAWVTPFGFISSSGFGEGVYNCFTHTDEDGKIDYVKIVFIDEDLFGGNLDDEYDDDFEDDYVMDDEY